MALADQVITLTLTNFTSKAFFAEGTLGQHAHAYVWRWCARSMIMRCTFNSNAYLTEPFVPEHVLSNVTILMVLKVVIEVGTGDAWKWKRRQE